MSIGVLQRLGEMQSLDSVATAPSPDILVAGGNQNAVAAAAVAVAACAECETLRRKYSRAKVTLAATLEKLQAANVRKDKVDRALSKELGKTQSVLSQARGFLEYANHNQNHQNANPNANHNQKPKTASRDLVNK